MWQRRGDTVQHTLDVDVDHPVPFGDLKELERRLRHQPRVVDHHIYTATSLNRSVDQLLDCIAVADVCLYRKRLAAVTAQIFG